MSDHAGVNAERLAGAGLAIAAITIVALALLARFELDREAALHREVIAALEVKDSLEALRVQLYDLRGAARAAFGPHPGDALQTIERRAVEIDAELQYLAQHPLRAGIAEAFEALSRASRLMAMQARSLSGAAAGSPPQVAAELDRLGAEADTALERALRAQRRRIAEGTVAQLRVGEGLRTYVAWLLAGSIAVLVGLFGFYRWAKAREARARRRMEYLAHHDTVTGLPNRALLADRLQLEVARARRTGQGFAVLLFDLDGFKSVNDTFGHAAGDEVLARVGERLAASVRASDTVGRLGGDEFLAILPQVGEEGALVVAEKLRAALQEPYALRSLTAQLSASLGVAFFPANGEDADALMNAADAAQYEAKRAGKNRIVLATRQAAVAQPACAPA